MTCIDDNASSHLGVSDGAASKQKTLTAEAGPGLVRVLPGDEGSQEWLGGLSMLSPVTMMSPRHHITRRGVNTIPLLPLYSIRAKTPGKSNYVCSLGIRKPLNQ